MRVWLTQSPGEHEGEAEMSDEEYAVKRIWDFAMQFAKKSNVEWRVVFAMFGVMTEKELNAWMRAAATTPSHSRLDLGLSRSFVPEATAPLSSPSSPQPRLSTSPTTLQPSLQTATSPAIPVNPPDCSSSTQLPHPVTILPQTSSILIRVPHSSSVGFEDAPRCIRRRQSFMGGTSFLLSRTYIPGSQMPDTSFAGRTHRRSTSRVEDITITLQLQPAPGLGNSSESFCIIIFYKPCQYKQDPLSGPSPIGSVSGPFRHGVNAKFKDFQHGILRIRRDADLDTYLNVANHYPQFSTAITVLEISMEILTASSLTKARILLSKTPHIVMFSLNVRTMSTSQCTRLLRNISFEGLTSFSTETLPHKGIFAFLSHHLSLTDISLGKCTELDCPFTTAHGFTKSWDIRGPSRCVASLISPLTHRLFAQVTTTNGASHAQLFANVTARGAQIFLLALDFLPTDTNLMRRIAAASPSVSTLHLTQFMDKKVPLPPSYPWSNTRSWGRNFRTLHHLKRFKLQTTDTLVSDPGNEIDEYILIKSWTGDEEKSHRQLDEIDLWYACESKASYMSFWRRQNNKWCRTSSIRNGNSSRFA
ncbi:hypothetical protein BDZ97DRAFT_1966116 [Flammula alnicola]|nr:hypothetical protein BDZ97DRAFT_1966116 [Flammula alnicola]